MPTKPLMAISALLMAVAGLAASFLPDEILNALGQHSDPSLAIIIQVMGALYLGFAILNWMAQGSTIGGIYGRPIALGNFLHFGAAAIALLKALRGAHHGWPLPVAAILYTILAIAFGYVMFGGSPVRKDANTAS